MGMIATGSHSFTVQNINVPKNRCFNLQVDHAVLPQPLYRFPFLQFAETTLAVNLAGMCRNFIDASRQLVERRQQEKTSPHLEYFSKKIEGAGVKLEVIREGFYLVVLEAYDQVTIGKTNTEPILNQVSEVSRKLATTTREVVDTLFPFCGLEAADTQSNLNRIWRNFHTATQHSLLNYPA